MSRIARGLVWFIPREHGAVGKDDCWYIMATKTLFINGLVIHLANINKAKQSVLNSGFNLVGPGLILFSLD